MDNLALWIPLISVLLSVISSLYITTLKNKSEMLKMKEQMREERDQRYSVSLFDKRLSDYPSLYEILSGYAKTIQYERQSAVTLTKFRDNLDSWNSRHSLLHTSDTAKLSGKFRHYIDVVLDKQDGVMEAHTDIWKLIGYYEEALRAEIGILNTLPAGELKRQINMACNYMDYKRGKQSASPMDKLPSVFGSKAK